MLQLKVNKKLLQQHLTMESGHVVTLKDIHNISSSSKVDSNELTVAIEELKRAQGLHEINFLFLVNFTS